MAMDEGADTPEEVADFVYEDSLNTGEVAGETPQQVAALYLQEWNSNGPYANVEFPWGGGQSGTFFEALLIHGARYIAEVAERIMQEEQGRISREPELEDYPLRPTGSYHRRKADADSEWVVSTRAPDGTHIIGEAPTQEEALRLLERHLGYRPGHLTMQDIPELVDDIGGVYSIEEEFKDWRSPGQKKTPSSMFDFWSWDEIIETGKIEDSVKDKLAEREGVDYLSYKHPVAQDLDSSGIEKALWEAIRKVVLEPYSAKGGKIYQEDLEAVAQALEGVHPEYGPMYAAELRALK